MKRTGETDSAPGAEAHVVAARRDREPVHLDPGVDRLERVVRRRQDLLVDPGRDDRAVGPVLGLEEALDVRLVPDHVLPHLRVAERDLPHVVRERRHPRRRVRRERERVDRLDRKHDPGAGRGGRGHHPVDERLLEDLRRRVLVPEHDRAVLAHAEVVHLAEEEGAAVVRVLHRVVRDPEADRGRRTGAAARSGRAEDAREQAEDERDDQEAAAAQAREVSRVGSGVV